jgi:hypothetical protein
MTDDLVKRLRYCAPERRDCSRNELAMLDAADRIEKLEEQLHYATGVADTNITGRLYAEGRIEKLEAALRELRAMHHEGGIDDLQERDDRTYFMVCEALEAIDPSPQLPSRD